MIKHSSVGNIGISAKEFKRKVLDYEYHTKNKNGEFKASNTIKNKTSMIDSSLKNSNYNKIDKSYVYQRPALKQMNNACEPTKKQQYVGSLGCEKQKNYKQIKNKLIELEDRLLTLKQSYQIGRRKKNSKSQKKLLTRQKINNQNLIIMPNKQITSSKISHYKGNFEDKEILNETKYALGQNKGLSMSNSQKQPQKKQDMLKKSQLADQQILSNYITQQNQKNVKLNKHRASDSNIALRNNIASIRCQQNKQIQEIYYYATVRKSLRMLNPTTFEQLFRNHFIASFEFLKMIHEKKIVKMPKKSPPQSLLPPPKKPQTIILDMDETLMHCIEKTEKGNLSDVKLPIVFPDKKKLTVGINIRPYAKQCLKELSKNFELIIFTASHSAYANVVIDYLDPQREYISHRFYRQSCFKSEEGFYVKDLRIINRNLNDLLLVDNAAYSYCFQPQNGVPIAPFYDNKADFELKSLVTYLNSFVGEKNMRKKNSAFMKLEKYSKFPNYQDLINFIFA